MDSPETSPTETTSQTPEQSAPAAPEPNSTEQRRGVLAVLFGSVAGFGFLAFAAASGLWAAVTARFMMPNVITEASQKFKAGFPSDYPDGYVETKYKVTHGVWIVNGRYGGQQEIFALMESDSFARFKRTESGKTMLVEKTKLQSWDIASAEAHLV